MPSTSRVIALVPWLQKIKSINQILRYFLNFSRRSALGKPFYNLDGALLSSTILSRGPFAFRIVLFYRNIPTSPRVIALVPWLRKIDEILVFLSNCLFWLLFQIVEYICQHNLYPWKGLLTLFQNMPSLASEIGSWNEMETRQYMFFLISYNKFSKLFLNFFPENYS